MSLAPVFKETFDFKETLGFATPKSVGVSVVAPVSVCFCVDMGVY